ncbi:PEP/pyruvate-binding domain-containing protein [Desulfobacula toluolica]|uniref:PpsA: phosphoenolpyruvate synthase/pyruvate phosphate dikinase (PEP synthase) n=1 Tax=Desulfobacula toluolica (strain DSM 7467 / Tol2) TaxID=651182 RepID=K0NF04_DESTT|nr:PEP/pyruvate-binding domain-containing protein [Desulfobacula toluolica]CCK78203.1 PpsA: phosphoenolpyruvate synthase/pyruvate phosphate dikinase (PEP synthase) [Desulfobacula toluolica Tol2]
MKSFLQLYDITDGDLEQVGGKTLALARLHQHKIRVPKTFCVPCHVYDSYLSGTRLKDRILMEINRKAIEKMRWEEIWDVSLRIRNFFLTTPIPGRLGQSLAREIHTHCGTAPVAVRSSAPAEDGKSTSFAGVHESFLNVSGTDAILKHIRLVWASLYSDAALLYRKELGLDISKSSMAVVIQELIPSDRSGVFFSINPSDSAQSVLESVYGLNQGLVDGDIDPDRWIIDRFSGNILKHTEPMRDHYAVPVLDGVSLESLPEDLRNKPPLNEQEIRQVWETGIKAERLFNRPQDMEWAFSRDRLVVLQARPVTSSGFKDSDDKRAWYLSLHRSHENLKTLHDKIENSLIPEMILTADKMGQIHLPEMTNAALANEIKTRQEIYDHWVKVYWADFIPFAHGIRLFGQVYNDAVRPEDPYEFMKLLEKTGLKSIERNRLLEKLADVIRQDPDLNETLAIGDEPAGDHLFMVLLEEFVSKFGDLACQTSGASECYQGNTAIIRIILQFARRPSAPALKNDKTDIHALREKYLACFYSEKQAFAKDILHLGRASYRLRDDDNIHLGRIEARLFEAVREGRNRLADPDAYPFDLERLAELPALSSHLEGPAPSPEKETASGVKDLWLKARQVVGHPAGPGIAKGCARVILEQDDLLEFKQGEVLICQGVDPNMTFVVPLAAAVIEERGGMLIHGAIIAREYGLPCVTGASHITGLIRTGDQVTVDGYLGIVTCDTGELES